MMEMVAVVVITAILAGIAVPRFSNSIALQQASSAARRIAADLEYARSRARTIGQAVTVSFNVSRDLYGLNNTPHIDHPDRNYRVFLDRDPYRATIRTVDCGGDISLVFDMYGKPDSGATITVSVGDFAKLILVDSESGEVYVADTTNVATVDTQVTAIDTDSVKIISNAGVLEVVDNLTSFDIKGR